VNVLKVLGLVTRNS